MASQIIEDKFLTVSSRAIIISVIFHIFVPVFFVTSHVFNLSGFKVVKKKTEEEIYQSYVQVDVVALPEEVGFKDEFVDPRLPVVDKPKVVEPPPAVEEAQEEKKAEPGMTLPDAAEAKRLEALKKQEEEKKRKEAEEKKRKAEKAKKEARRKKREAEAKKAMEDLKRRMEREKAIKELANGKEGRKEIAGNILSKGSSTRGKIGKEQERYIALIKEAIKSNFNVFEWLKTKSLEAHVHIAIAGSGEILSRELVKSSGNARYDSAVLQAIDDTRKLPPPPEGSQIADDGATIVFTP